MNSTAQQNTLRNLTVVGFYPSGDGFSEMVQAATPYDAKISALASQRYTESGGDLSILCVIDTDTGNVIDETASCSDRDLLTESDAIEQVLLAAAQCLPREDYSQVSESSSTRRRFAAHIEFFDMLLRDSPEVLENLTLCGNGYSDEDLMVEFEDSLGALHEFRPSQALAGLADLVLEHQWTVAGLQTKALATVGGVSFDLACLDSIEDY